MPQAKRLGLPDINATHAFRQDGTHLSEERVLAFALELRFELVGFVEMVLNGTLVPAGNEDHVGDSSRGSLLDRILDERFVDDRHHLLGARLRDGQEPAAKSGHGEYRFLEPGHHRSFKSSISCVSSITGTPRLRA